MDAEGNFLGDILKYTANLIPEDKLRFALGIGTTEDIRRCAKMGWDMFDCVIPTREGRHGRLFIGSKNKNKSSCKTINILNSKFADYFKPINPDSSLKELREHTIAYLHHLFKLKEPLGHRLSALNNLEYYLNLVKNIKS